MIACECVLSIEYSAFGEELSEIVDDADEIDREGEFYIWLRQSSCKPGFEMKKLVTHLLVRLPDNRSNLLRMYLGKLHASYALSGCVGNNVIVEAPFNCDYGYNIHIGHDVVIGKNCTILDSCKVKIGGRCILGPNVNIYTVS